VTAIQGGQLELELPCMLTDEEVQSRGRMLGETIWSIDETNTARTEAMKKFKERLVGSMSSNANWLGSFATGLSRGWCTARCGFTCPARG